MQSKEPILSVPFDLGVNTLQPHISLRPGVRIKCLMVSVCVSGDFLEIIRQMV